jgi:selenoprotein W-related protein
MQQPILEISLEYCAPCGYTERVLRLTEEILGDREIEAKIASWTLLPSKGGVFELIVNGELVFSKKTRGRHAEPGEIASLIRAKLDDLKPLPDEQGPSQPA